MVDGDGGGRKKVEGEYDTHTHIYNIHVDGTRWL